jgi:hypothetical protein
MKCVHKHTATALKRNYTPTCFLPFKLRIRILQDSIVIFVMKLIVKEKHIPEHLSFFLWNIFSLNFTFRENLVYKLQNTLVIFYKYI